MSEKFLLNLLYVLAALAFWLLPVLLRWLKKRKEQAAVDQPRPAEPHPEAEELPDLGPLMSPGNRGLEELESLLAEFEELAVDARELKRSCSGPGLARFNQLIDEAITTPLQELQRAVQAGIDAPAAVDPFRLVSESTESMMQMRSAEAFFTRIIADHRVKGHSAKNARGTALARIFLVRLEGLLHKGAGPPSNPVFVPVEQPALLHPGLLSALAVTRAVPFDARAGRSSSPRAWTAVARDVARWAYRRMPGLELEIEQRYAAMLDELGYQAALPPEGLTREVFIHALLALQLGPGYARAVESDTEGVGGEDIARRMLELSLPEDEQQGELALPIEIMLHVLHGQPLESLSGSRLPDISGLDFMTSDVENAAAAAAALLEGRAPGEAEFHVVTGAMLASLDQPANAPAVAAAADRALGLAGTHEAWQDKAPAAPARRRPAGFLSARAVREAIVVGALLER